MRTQLKLTMYGALALLTTVVLPAEQLGAQQIRNRVKTRVSPQQKLLDSVKRNQTQSQSPRRFPKEASGSTRVNRLRIASDNQQGGDQQGGGVLKHRKSSGTWGKRDRTPLEAGKTYHYGRNRKNSGAGPDGIFRGSGPNGQRIRIIKMNYREASDGGVSDSNRNGPNGMFGRNRNGNGPFGRNRNGDGSLSGIRDGNGGVFDGRRGGNGGVLDGIRGGNGGAFDGNRSSSGGVLGKSRSGNSGLLSGNRSRNRSGGGKGGLLGGNRNGGGLLSGIDSERLGNMLGMAASITSAYAGAAQSNSGSYQGSNRAELQRYYDETKAATSWGQTGRDNFNIMQRP